MWRNLKHIKCHGFSHSPEGTESSLGPGDMALFCTACPQPGVNLPADSEKKYPRCDTHFLLVLYHVAFQALICLISWTLTRSFVQDGHFLAKHLRMKSPWDDVALSDGSGFMTQDGPYKAHLAQAKEVKDVSGLSRLLAVFKPRIPSVPVAIITRQ